MLREYRGGECPAEACRDLPVMSPFWHRSRGSLVTLFCALDPRGIKLGTLKKGRGMSLQVCTSLKR